VRVKEALFALFPLPIATVSAVQAVSLPVVVPPVLSDGETGDAVHPALIVRLMTIASTGIGKVGDNGMKQVFPVLCSGSVSVPVSYLIIGKPFAVKLVIAVTFVIVLLSTVSSVRLDTAQGLCPLVLESAQLTAPLAHALRCF